MRKIPCISFVAIYILLFVVSANAQLKTPPVIEWQRSLGGSDYECAFSIQQTSDGGFITVGETISLDGDVNKINGGYDSWVVKLSPSGMTEWKKLYGGNGTDGSMSIQENKDGSYIIGGHSYSNDVDVKDHIRDDDMWIVKLTDSALNWEKSLGGTGNEQATSVTATFDGGYIAAGYTSSTDGMAVGNHGDYDYFVVKLASDGSKEWSRCYGGGAFDFAVSVQQTLDSGYIIAGGSDSDDGDITENRGRSDYWVIKLSKEGNIEWQKSLGGSDDDHANYLRQTADGGYIVVGYSQSIDGDVNGHFGNKDVEDMWVVKLTDSGSIEWDRSLGGTKSDGGLSVCQTNDGGYVIAGGTDSHNGNVSFNHGETDFLLVKLSNTGILEWERTFGGSNDEIPHSIQQTTEGGFIVAGRSGSNDGDVTGNHGGYDFWIVKLSPEDPSSVEDEPVAVSYVSITPNPAQTSTTLTLESNEVGMCEVQIISVTGITLKQYSTHLAIGKQEIELRDLESLPSGMYEVLVKRNGHLISQTKLIIE